MKMKQVIRSKDPIMPAANMSLCSLKPVDGMIEWSIDGKTLVLTPEQADQLAADFREASIVARNGGQPC